jgi:hypothetical protein
MDPKRLMKVRQIFEDALEKSGPAREVLLDQCCGNDTELRTIVEQMIDADGKSNDLLDRPLLLGGFKGSQRCEGGAPEAG